MSYRNGAFPSRINTPDYYKNKQFIFIDISGFTPLCDRFIRESSYGAEKIGDLVNTVFNPIIDFVFEKGGDVISFAGDALFVAVDKKAVKPVQKMAQKLIKEQTISKDLAITIDMLEDEYYPNIINTKQGSMFSYYPQEDEKSKLKNVYPNEIYDIYKSNFRGELRAVPVFFIHISEKYSVNDIRPLLEFLTVRSKENSVYINKIEYLDKGWMILLSAGSPIYSSEAPVKIYDLLSKFSKKAKTMSIPVQIGGTLQRGYCGIIGNEKRWEFTFLGSNVNLAARIAFSSEDYKISCDESFVHSAHNLLKSKSIGIKKYKGVGEREVFELTGKIKDKKNIFIGREKEITDALNLFSGSRRAFMLINGPSGIGKTMLAEQIITSLGIENIIRLKGMYGDDEPNYIFKQIKGCSELNSAQLFKKIKSISEPTLIYIDDLHFADDNSFFLLHRMINEGNPFVNILTTTIGKEKIMITPFCFYETYMLDLKPFDAKDIQSITKLYSGIDITLKVSKELLKTTKGNPLFINGILPYITKDTASTGKVPYSLEEIILLKLSQIPDKGPEFIDGGSVYGEIFEHDLIKEVIDLKKNTVKSIISKAEHEGIIRRSLSNEEIEFSNTIIREIIYEKLLKKKINFFRTKIAEVIITTKTQDVKKLHKAAMMYFFAEDKRALDLSAELAQIYLEKKEYILLGDVLILSLKMIKKKKMYNRAFIFIEYFSKINDNIKAELIELIEQIALKVNDWKNNEGILIKIARIIFSIRFKAPEIILGKYVELKGEDKYYLWAKAKTCSYIMKNDDVVNIYNDIKSKFKGDERLLFYMDYVAFAFFTLGDLEMEKEGMDIFSIRFKAPEIILGKYVELKGEDKYYLWAKAKTCSYIMKNDDVVNIYNDIKSKFKGDERLLFYMDYVAFAFFTLGDLEMEKEGMDILLRYEKNMADNLMIDFLLLKNTIAIHRDDMDTAQKCLESLMRLPSRNPMEKFSLQNDFAILYSNLAVKNFSADDFKKALKYSVRSQKILTDYQKSSDLPLITTNLASFYLSAGKMKKAEKAMLEGLYYGIAVDHPVEVPYTKTRIAFLTTASGAYKLSANIGNDVVKNKKVIDLLPCGYTLKYLYGRENKKNLDLAMKYAKKMLGFGTAKCYWEISSLRTYKALVDDDKKLLKILRKDILNFKKYPQRPANKFSHEVSAEAIGILTGEIKTDKKLKSYLKKLEKININFGLRSNCHYAIGRLNKDIEHLKLAKKFALKMKMYPFVLRIEEELFELTKDKYWSKRIKLSEKKLEQMNKIKTIEEFFGYGKAK